MINRDALRNITNDIAMAQTGIAAERRADWSTGDAEVDAQLSVVHAAVEKLLQLVNIADAKGNIEQLEQRLAEARAKLAGN